MELRELWKIVLRRWWLILLPVLAAGALAAYDILTAPPGTGPSYSTSIRFTAATPPETGETLGYEDREYYPWLTSEYVVNALTDWVRTGSFAEEVSAALAADDIDVPASAIQGGINADNERSVMQLTLSNPDPEVLAAVAGAAGDVLETRSSVYFPQFGEGGVEVVQLDTPAIGAVPPQLTSRLTPILTVLLALVAGVALAFLIEYLDPTIRERRQVEALDVPVLAEVPKHK